MDKEFKIVPTTGDFGTIVAANPVEALEIFADGMDSDMGAYFQAQDAGESGLHKYDQPKNRVEVQINMYIGSLEGSGKNYLVSPVKTACVKNLQECYDAVAASDAYKNLKETAYERNMFSNRFAPLLGDILGLPL